MKVIIRTLFIAILSITITACTGALGGDEGTSANPVSLGNYPVSGHNGSVGIAVSASDGSFYKVDGISPGGTYNVNLTNTSGNVWMYVYDDNSYSISSVLCTDGGIAAGDRTCSTSFPTPTGTSIYIQVINTEPSNNTYTVSVN